MFSLVRSVLRFVPLEAHPGRMIRQWLTKSMADPARCNDRSSQRIDVQLRSSGSVAPGDRLLQRLVRSRSTRASCMRRPSRGSAWSAAPLDYVPDCKHHRQPHLISTSGATSGVNQIYAGIRMSNDFPV
jgi:hypothetical protein